jgi:protein-S-isoprenylcysteine O-methyltransferase Ste14
MPYRLIYDGLWLVLAAYWIASIPGNKPTAYQVDPARRYLVLVGVGVLLWLFIAFPEIFSRRVIPFSRAAEWIGIALCAGGVAFAIWARRTLGRNWSGNPSIKEGHELIEACPYRPARHPIYTGILTAVIGTLIGGGKVREIIILAGSLAILWVKIRVEETLMMRQFPQAYPEYKKRTRALIPFVL